MTKMICCMLATIILILPRLSPAFLPQLSLYHHNCPLFAHHHNYPYLVWTIHVLFPKIPLYTTFIFYSYHKFPYITTIITVSSYTQKKKFSKYLCFLIKSTILDHCQIVYMSCIIVTLHVLVYCVSKHASIRLVQPNFKIHDVHVVR